MSESVFIGVDVGATKILVGAVRQTGNIISSRRFKMEHETRAITLHSIHNALEVFMQAWDGPAPRAIGIGLVGQIDPETGTWLEAMNLPIKSPVPLAGQVRDRFGIPVALDNDVHAATMAELHWGIGTESKDFLYLNIGTGVSAGLVFGGQLLRGSKNYAGELGHMVVQSDGELCPCGRRGCLEPIVSGGGMLARVKKELPNHPDSILHSFGKTLTTHQIFKAADAGDPLAGKISNDAIDSLGTALVNLVNLLNPEWIVYGGGTLSDGWLIDHVRENVETGPLTMIRKSLKGIIPSRLNPEQVGLLGAACLALDIGGIK
jgi:glucokinase